MSLNLKLTGSLWRALQYRCKYFHETVMLKEVNELFNTIGGSH